MNDYKVIHETVISDIINIWDSMKDFAKDKDKYIRKYGKRNDMSTSSMTRLNSSLVLTFPILCSKGISVETASMISKAVERFCASMMQRLFSAFQLQDKSDVENLKDFISRFHTNIDGRTFGFDDILDISYKLSEAADIKSATIAENAAAPYIMEDMRNINFVMPSDISESSLNSFTVSMDVVSEGAASGAIKMNADAKKAASEYFKNQVLDSDYKKANELQPTNIVVNFKVINDNGEATTFENAVVGIKAKLYPIPSEDVVSHITSKNQDRNWLNKFIRATTREISFIKDFCLAIDKAKIDALSLSSRKSASDKMWKVLERRANVSRLKRSLQQANNANAITTLCVSQDEVEFMRKHDNVDLEKVSTVIGLFESYNLMCICIVDENLEVAKFIFDEEDPMWETISFTHLEREASDNTYKRVVNLMTKISR